jgi:outer membrane protein
MNTRSILTLIGLLCLAVGAAWAQVGTGPVVARLPQVQGPVQLNPDTAAALAVQRSTDQALSQTNVEQARGALQQANALNGWQVDLGASYARMGPTLTADIGGTSVVLNPPYSMREDLTVSKPLYLGGRDTYAVAGAKAGLRAARDYVDATAITVAAAARRAVYMVLRLQQLAVVAQERMTAVAEHLRLAQAMNEQGTVAKFEVVQAETELSRAKGDVIAAETSVEQQKSALAQVLNLPQGLSMTLEEGKPLAVPEGDLHKLTAVAFDQRPELHALTAAVEAGQAALKVAEANDRMTVALQGSVNNQTATAFSQSQGWTVAVAVDQPLYKGGQTRALITQAQAGLRTASLNLEKAQQQIAMQVNQALLSLQEARSALTVAEQGEVNARERLRIAQVRFTNGVSLGVEVLDAQAALAAAQTQVINSRYDLQVAVTNLRAALGYVDIAKESAR